MAAADEIEKQTERIATYLEKAQIAEYVQLLKSPRQLIIANFIAGISRGVGIALGLTIFSATIVYILRQLGTLDLPIIGQYIAELVKVVQSHLQSGYY